MESCFNISAFSSVVIDFATDLKASNGPSDSGIVAPSYISNLKIYPSSVTKKEQQEPYIVNFMFEYGVNKKYIISQKESGMIIKGIINTMDAADKSNIAKILEEYISGGQDPNKAASLILNLIENNNFKFSGNLLSAIWDKFDKKLFDSDTLEINRFKIRRVEK